LATRFWVWLRLSLVSGYFLFASRIARAIASLTATARQQALPDSAASPVPAVVSQPTAFPCRSLRHSSWHRQAALGAVLPAGHDKYPTPHPLAPFGVSSRGIGLGI